MATTPLTLAQVDYGSTQKSAVLAQWSSIGSTLTGSDFDAIAADSELSRCKKALAALIVALMSGT